MPLKRTQERHGWAIVCEKTEHGLRVRILIFPSCSCQGAAAQNEWLTWGHDQERSGSNQAEKTLNKDNVSRLEVKWKSQLSTPPRN